MKEKIVNIFKKKFVKNVMVVASGTILAQLITFALLPIVTRLYGPEAYGIMGTFLSMIQIFMPVAALALPIAIVLPETRQEAISIVKASYKIMFMLALVVLVILAFSYESIISLFNIEEIGYYIFLLPLVIVLGGFFEVMRQWTIRYNQFNIMANATVYQALFSHGGMVLVGLFYPVASVLILFTAVKHGFAAWIMYLKSTKQSTSNMNLNEASYGFKDIVSKHRDFPKFRGPQVLLNGIAQNFPVLLLTTFFGPAAAGYYTLSRSVLSLPVQLLGKSVGEVFYPRFAEAYNKQERLGDLMLKATGSLFLLGALPFGVIIIFGPWIFELVFGADWTVAGEYARWVSLWLWLLLTNRPAVHSLPVLSAQKFHLQFTVVSTIVRVGALLAGYYVYTSDVAAVALFSVSGALLNIILIGVTYLKCKHVEQMNH